MDDIPVFSPYHGLGQFSAIGPDAIGRVELHAGVPPVAWGDALSSVVDLQTRKPGSSDVGLRGAVTATGARLTADGPLAIGAGFLVSGGWASPGFLAPSSEDSYVRGSFTHSLAKLEWPLEIGLVRVLGFQSDNALRMRSVPASDAGGETLETGSGAIGSAGIETMNRFSWHSRSYGLVWEKPIGQRAIIDARLWHSSMDAVADWLAVESSLEMSGRRRNLGSRLRLTVDGEDARSLVGLSLERDRTAYAVRAAASGLVSGDPAPSSDLRARGIVFAAFAEHQRLLLRRVQLLMGLRGSGASGDDLRMAPRLSVHWPISTLFSVSAGCARTYQRVQSLRNPESLLENIFSPELPIHVGADGVPTARADQLALALEAHPAPGMRVGLETFTRALDGLILVAPNTGLPFAAGGFSLGSSEAWGIGVDLELRRARYRTLATYGFASVTNEMWDSEYRPSFATTHLITTGAVYYPAKEVELRSALRAEIGRPTTLMEGPFVWEPCSVLEGGCEAEGSPQRLVGPLGGHGLPAYVRVDIGGRKHWHARVLGREGTITAYATLSNVFGRRNVLGYVSDPLTGERSAIPMRPFSPLTAGLEWRF